MNSNELAQAWERVCDLVKQDPSIDRGQFEALSSRLQPQAMSDGYLMVTADNDFIRNWIEIHYKKHLINALNKLYGREYKVDLVVDPQQAIPAQQEKAAVVEDNKGRKDEEQNEPVFTSAEEKPFTTESETKSVKPQVTRDEEVAEDIQFPMSTLTFENFVVGPSNNLAYSMALSVAENPGRPTFNPLFIYGKSGLGKTHLLRAIQNNINVSMPYMKTIYVDSAEFLSEYVDATIAHEKQKTSYKLFKEKYQDADVLLIDDVQYFQGKGQTLDMVFEIFNKFIDRGKQIVLSADRAPKNIDIDERYSSRFNSGGTVDIQPPEVETKLGIIKSFIEEYKQMNSLDNFEIPREIQDYIAENSSSNIRELKSAVTKIVFGMGALGDGTLTLSAARELLENHFSGGVTKKLSIADIQKQVELYFQVSHSDLIGNKRPRDISYARQIAIYLCRQMLDLPYKYIGQQFGGKDHTTVMYAVTNVENKMKDNREMREQIEFIKKRINEM